jgi:plastocyanin
MPPTSTASSLPLYAAIGIAIVAVVIAGIAMYFATTGMDPIDDQTPDVAAITQPAQEREIYLFSEVDENINEEMLGIPPDKFSSDLIVVNQGDSVEIHFYNLEPVETQEKHSFTIAAAQYQMHYDVEAGENVEIEFVAGEAGVYEYVCVYHMPTMQGKMVVLPVAR